MLTLVRALLRLQPDIVISRLSQKIDILAAHNSGQAASNVQVVMDSSTQSYITRAEDTTIANRILRKGGKTHKELNTTVFRTYIWLLNWACDFELYRSKCGWTFNLRTYRIVSESSAFEMVYRNDVNGLGMLLAKGEVRPNDCMTMTYGDYQYKSFTSC